MKGLYFEKHAAQKHRKDQDQVLKNFHKTLDEENDTHEQERGTLLASASKEKKTLTLIAKKSDHKLYEPLQNNSIPRSPFTKAVKNNDEDEETSTTSKHAKGAFILSLLSVLMIFLSSILSFSGKGAGILFAIAEILVLIFGLIACAKAFRDVRYNGLKGKKLAIAALIILIAPFLAFIIALIFFL
ncbi:MAG: hypothetical protein ACXVC6_11380 [Bacteroidia bacterium]